MCVITIENIESETIIGVEEHERTHLTPVIVTVVIRYDSSKAEKNDDIAEAVEIADVFIYAHPALSPLIRAVATVDGALRAIYFARVGFAV